MNNGDSPDRQYLGRIENLSLRPVFIMGPHRSGTTILYKTLAATGCFNLTTAFHVLHADSLLSLHESGEEAAARARLQDEFDAKGLRDRTFDSVKISPDIPEEYCYAFERQDARPRLDERNAPGFLRFVAKVQYTQGPDRPVLLKNPFDADNLAYLRQAVPNARFVFIQRNPVEVISSQLQAVRSLLEEPNEYVAMVVKRYRDTLRNPAKLALGRLVYSSKLPFLVRTVSNNMTNVFGSVLRDLNNAGPEAMWVTYPQLCEQPRQTIESILSFLGEDARDSVDYESLIQPRRPKIAPEVERRRDQILERNQAYCEAFDV